MKWLPLEFYVAATILVIFELVHFVLFLSRPTDLWWEP
jgi:hypothetical protein